MTGNVDEHYLGKPNLGASHHGDEDAEVDV